MVAQPTATEIAASQVLAKLAGRLLPATWVLAGSEAEQYLQVQELLARKGYLAIDNAQRDVLGEPNANKCIAATDQLIAAHQGA